MTAKKTAKPKANAISRVNPDFCNANPPLRPNAINRYKDKNLAIGCGISRLDLTAPANAPKIKKRMAGSKKLLIASS
jgi:hypothetical protein